MELHILHHHIHNNYHHDPWSDQPHNHQVELYILHPGADPIKAANMQALEASIYRWLQMILIMMMIAIVDIDIDQFETITMIVW